MRSAWKLFAIILVIGFTTLLLSQSRTTTAIAQATQEEVKSSSVFVEPELLTQFETNREAGYLIYFRDKADLSAAYDMDWEARGKYVMETLQATAKASQANVLAYLDTQGVDYQSFWIDNIVAVTVSDRATMENLRTFDEIESLRARRTMSVIEPEPASNTPNAPDAVEPNISHVLATDVWALGILGSGSVVANIDTGARYTHLALNSQYRGNLGGGSYNHNYNWWDPYGNHPAMPADDNGHGSHTMGTMIGDDGGTNQIGMAPDAEWIACRGCNTSSCSDTSLLSCAQWIAAPWDLSQQNPDPNMRPHVVNNSWGDCGQSYDPWYQGVVDGWHAAGVYPVFSNGNASNCGYPAPPGLNTVGNPARYGNVTGVGSTGQSNGLYATHSNWGPTDNPDTVNPHPGWADLKPQVLAPGVGIRSSVNSGDTAYASYTGTSMSAPHVAGLVALMWEAAPCLIGDYATTETIIEDTATPIPYDTGGGASVPNYATGWGEINALAAVQMAQTMCGPSGGIAGTVTDSGTSSPLAGVQIAATLDMTTTLMATTDDMGEYEIGFAPVGFYTMTASTFGYLPATVTNVEVVSGTITTQDFALTQAPSAVIDGTVTDANTGWPLYAAIHVDGVPGSPFWNDPETGYYSISLPEGSTYDFTVEAFVAGYIAEMRAVGPVSGNTTEDFGLDVDVVSCTAPGYEPGYAFITQEDFEADDGGYVASGTVDGWEWGDPVSWPADCASGTNCWGTNLDGNYSASANTVLTSPVIDLSGETGTLLAFWSQAWHIESSSWDHGYAEVSIDGGPWQVMWEHVGSTVQVGWTDFSYDVSAAAGSDVQFRFRLTSDTSVQYNGYYIDDVAIASAGCLPKLGGLAVGNVYDDNTGDGLTGAMVEGEGGVMATAVTTPDPAVDDAFYTIFVPEGTTTITATNGSRYGMETATLTVVDGTTQLYDFNLPAGWLVATPDAISAAVELGSTGSTNLDLDNLGSNAVEFEIIERDTGNALLAGEDFLVVNDGGTNTTQVSAMTTALDNLGYSHLVVTSAQFTALPIDELLTYRAVLYAGIPNTGAEADTVMAYLDAGGSFLVADNDFGWSMNASALYQTYMQATYASDAGSDGIVTGVDIMDGIVTDISSDPFPDDFIVGAEGVEIFEAISGNSAGVMVDRMGYRAIYLAWDYHYAGGSVVGDPVETEIMERALGFLAAFDVPWLNTDVVTGTIPAMGTQPVTVGFDASVVPQPGEYYAELNVNNDTPYGRLTIPVTMTVTAPDTFGFLEGTVSSQGYCDADPFPAAGALVEIEATGGMTWTLEADEMGYYSIYLDESYSPVSITVTAPEHEEGFADGVVIVGTQTTTQDFALRWLKPCIAVDPASLSETVPFGQTATQSLMLGNSGAYTLTFELREQDGGFNPAFSVQVVPAGTADTARQAPAVSGNPTVAEKGVADRTAVAGPASGGPAPEDIGDSWEIMAPLPAGRVFNAVVADQNGYIYVIGGTSDAGGLTPTNTNYRYNTTTNTWDTMAPMPASLDSIDGIEINNKIYIPGDDVTATTYVYDIATNTWSTIPANGGYTPRSQYQVVAMGDDLYVLGGIVAAASASTTEVWVLDTTSGTWSAGVPMQKSRTSFSAAAIDGEIFVAGGVLFPGFTPDMTAEKFDGSSWSYVANVPDGGGAYTRWSYNADGHGADGLWLGAGRRDAGWAVLNHAGYYDPSTDTWTDSPTIPILNQGRVYMEGDVAADGYFYVIGGRDSAGAIIYTTNERLYVGSPASGDVLWLSEDVTSGEVAPDGGEQEIIVTFDASVVTEPGDYLASLRVVSNDPMMGAYSIPVTMTVQPSANAGYIEGTVQSLGYCDNNPFPAEGAEVVISSGANSWTLYTNANGEYGLWLDESYSPVDISVTAPEHEAGLAEDVAFTAQTTTTVNFDLRWLQPCVTVEPQAFDVELGLGSTVAYPLDIFNNGAAATGFELREVPATARAPFVDLIQDGGFEAGTPNPFWDEFSTNFGTPLCDEASCGTGGGTAGPNSGAWWVWLGGIGAFEEGYVEQDVTIPVGTASLSFYFWIGTTGGPAADYFAVEIDGNEIFRAGADEQPSYSSYTLVELDISSYADGGLHTVTFYGLTNGSTTTNFNLDDVMLDSTEGSLDVLWLSTDPITGTVGADDMTTADVIFDTTVLTQTGVYNAFLHVLTDDPMYPAIEVPITLTVSAPNAAITLDVTVSTENECGTTDTLEVDPGTTVYYCYTVTNTGNVMLPNHTITDTVFGHIDTFLYDLLPGMSESVIYPQVIDEDVSSTVMWMAENADMAMSAMATDTVSVTLTTRYLYLPIVIKP